MSKTTLLSQTEINLINGLPLVSTQVLNALLNALYAEPGYSDVEVKDLARTLEMDVKIVKGAIGHLTKLGLVDTDSVKVNNTRMELVYSGLHGYHPMGEQYIALDDAARWADGDPGDRRKEQALELTFDRLAFLNEKIAPSKGGKGMTLAEAEKLPTVAPVSVPEAPKSHRPVKGSPEAKALMVRVRASLPKKAK